MEKKDADLLADLLKGITEKVSKQSEEHRKVESVLVDLTDELKTCVSELRTMVEDGLVELTAMQKDPGADPNNGFRQLGKIEGWHDASVMLVDLTMRVLGRIHGTVQ